MDSIPSSYTNGSSSPGPPHSLEPDISPDEQEEKARLISQVLELQNTLDGKHACIFFVLCLNYFFFFAFT